MHHGLQQLVQSHHEDGHIVVQAALHCGRPPAQLCRPSLLLRRNCDEGTPAKLLCIDPPRYYVYTGAIERKFGVTSSRCHSACSAQRWISRLVSLTLKYMRNVRFLLSAEDERFHPGTFSCPDLQEEKVGSPAEEHDPLDIDTHV